MPTLKQKQAVDIMLENGGNVSKAMEAVGYRKTTAHTPQKLTESKGFQELCEQNGLTDNFLLKALVNDIKKKPKNRKAELELGFKVKGRLKEREEPTGVTLNIQISEHIAEKIKEVYAPDTSSN